MKPLLISWDRGRRSTPQIHSPTGGSEPVAASTRCLASWGFLLDRAALARNVGGSADAPDETLLADRYRQVGLGLAEEVGGSLCAVLWDQERQRLVVLRDRMGLGAGLCWCLDDDRLLLARSAWDLARATGRPVRPDSTSVLLHLHGCGPLPGRTYFEGISRVPPGAWLIATDRGVRIRQYWSVEPGADVEHRSEDQAAEELREVLQAVGREWAPLGPAAVSLSGGMDSPSIAAAVRRSAPRQLAVGVHYSTPRLEATGESDLARRTARLLGLRLRCFDGMEWWPLRGADGPLTRADGPYRSSYSEVWKETFRISAEEGAGVLFTGAGGDHLFWGPRAYEFPDLLWSGAWGKLAGRWRRHPRPRPTARQILSATLHAALPPGIVASRYRVPWLPRARRGEWADGFAGLQPSRRSPSAHELTLFLRDGMVFENVEALEDMAQPYGIELRHPFFDHRLVELAARLPPGMVARDGMRKRLLRAAVRPWLPEPLVDRREKIFPTEILDRGLRDRETERVWSLLEGMRAAEMGWVDEKRLRSEYRRYLAARGDFRWWHAITLESWLRQWF